MENKIPGSFMNPFGAMYPTKNDCEACLIENDNREVKQRPRHTCGIDGKKDDDMLKEKSNKIAQIDRNSAYNSKVLEIAVKLAKTAYERRHHTLTWEQQGHHYRDLAIEVKTDEARAMVAEMYKSYQYGHVDGMRHEPYGDRPCHDSAIYRGLTPKTNT